MIDLAPSPAGAEFRDGDRCRLRLRLWRRWDPGPVICYIGHNPSMAGLISAMQGDPTTACWMRIAKGWGFGAYVAVNLYPWVSANPELAHELATRALSGNAPHIRDELLFVNLPVVVKAAKGAHKVVACWGAIARDHQFVEHVVEEIQNGEAPWPDLYVLGLTKSGAPKHPMARGRARVPDGAKPLLWRSVRTRVVDRHGRASPL